MNPEARTAGVVADSQPESWSVATTSGLHLRLPASMRSLTTYVMLEQECWFEPEMSLLPHLLAGGVHALDIGANHGLYTLEMARCSGNGRVWAFEPTSTPRARLVRSVDEAGLGARVVVVDAALAETQGEASFAVHDNSELNSRDGSGARRERVRLETLDAYLDANASGVEIGFVKLDAEGDETRVLAGGRRFFASQSPVVLFEYKHGAAVNAELIDAWRELGFGIFRWSAELDLLLPFDPATGEAAFALNLVAIRPAVQVRLAAQGLLVSADALANATTLPDRLDCSGVSGLQAWCARPALHGLMADDAQAGGAVYAAALRGVAAAHLQSGLAPEQRVALMLAARDSVLAAIDAGTAFGPEAWVLVVHCLHALGQQHAAVQLGAGVLAGWPQDAQISLPFVPPQLADLERERSTPAASWLRQMLAEFVATRSSFSSYFGSPVPQRWAALLVHPDHGAEIERRYLLAHVLADSVASVQCLSRLPDPRHTCNPFLWQGLIKAMQVMLPIQPLVTEPRLATLPAVPLAA